MVRRQRALTLGWPARSAHCDLRAAARGCSHDRDPIHAVPEGPALEWEDVLEAVLDRSECNFFDRVACEPHAGGVRLYSPRNAYHAEDFLDMEWEELERLIRFMLGK